MTLVSDRSPEYWAITAGLPELGEAVRLTADLRDEDAAVLDFVYRTRAIKAIQSVDPQEADDLIDHLERVAHDTVKEELDALSERYFTRWRLLSELLVWHRVDLEMRAKLGKEDEAKLWFFVSDYPRARDSLELAYSLHGVEEHSAEPGRTRGNPDDADVTVRGPASRVLAFRKWLEGGGLRTLRRVEVEGEPIRGSR